MFGHRYFGPGNPIDNGEPIDSDDRIALIHDLHYEFAETDSDVRRADRAAIADFMSDAVENRNWHSVAGAAGLGVKYLTETVVGVQYPRGIKKGIPTAVKWLVKATTAAPPTLRGGEQSLVEEDNFGGRYDSRISAAEHRRKMEVKNEEFVRKNAEREAEYARYKVERDRRAAQEEYRWEVVQSRRTREKLEKEAKRLRELEWERKVREMGGCNSKSCEVESEVEAEEGAESDISTQMDEEELVFNYNEPPDFEVEGNPGDREDSGKKEEEVIFKPRKSLPRSPVRMEEEEAAGGSQADKILSVLVSGEPSKEGRYSLLRDEDMRMRSGSLDRLTKRKRVEEEGVQQEEAGELTARVSKLKRRVVELLALLRSNPAIKKEIREVGCRLEVDVKGLEGFIKKGGSSGQVKRGATVDSATQTDRMVGVHSVRKALEEGITREEIPMLVAKRWEEGLYTSVKDVNAKDAFSEDRDFVFVVDVKEDEGSDFGRKIRRRLGYLDELWKAGLLSAGQIIRDDRSAQVIAGDRVDLSGHKTFVIVTDAAQGRDSGVRCILDGLYKLAEYIHPDTVFGVAEGPRREQLRKLLEYRARRYKCQHWVLKDENRKVVKAPRGPESKVVRVSAEGRSFADLLKTVKGSVQADELGEVLAMRKGVKNDLIIKVKGDEKKAEEVKAKLEEKVQGVSVTRIGRPPRKAVVLVKDLESDVDGGLVKEVLEKVTGEKCFSVPRLRAAYGDTKVASVVVSEKAARVLCEMKRVRVGFVSCRVVKNEYEDRCYRCLEFGHIARACKGPDRKDLCYKCGEKGHKIAECQNEKKCLRCGKEGHGMGMPCNEDTTN